MTTLATLALAAGVLAVLAVVMGYILGWANRAFHVDVDARVAAINEALPGANCGGCGFVGCGDYAEAVVRGEAKADLCAPGGAGCAKKIAEVLGIEVSDSLPYRPVIHCVAKKEHKLLKMEYHGEQSCTAANLVAGIQGCTYGCLGFGDCYRACNYGAIKMVDGGPEIIYDKCVGCKACAKACPRNVISMVPWKADTMLVVGCSNQDTALAVKEVCEIGCIGCSLCAKKSPGLFTMKGNLPAVDYEIYDPSKRDEAPALEKCPRQSLVYVGKPRKEDVEAVADEVLPEQIRADFETTADETEWRG